MTTRPFFNNGSTTADFHETSNSDDSSDCLTIFVISGIKVTACRFINELGKGSSMHVVDFVFDNTLETLLWLPEKLSSEMIQVSMEDQTMYAHQENFWSSLSYHKSSSQSSLQILGKEDQVVDCLWLCRWGQTQYYQVCERHCHTPWSCFRSVEFYAENISLE